MAAKKARPTSPAPREKDAAREAEHLKAIIEAPDDLSPRLVYADWLAEHGDPRGEFIQIQCELDRPLWCNRPAPNGEGRQGELGAREQALLKKHTKQWLEPVRPYIRIWVWRRGFIETLYVNASFFDGAKAVATNHPVRTLCFEGLKAGDIPRFQDVELGNLQQVDLTGAPITEKTAGAFLGTNFARIEILRFYNARLRGKAMVDLAQKSHLRALKRLDLGACFLDDEGFRALASSPVLGQLEALDLSSNTVSPEAAMTLVESKALAKLKTVHVNEFFVTAAGAATMTAYEKRFDVKHK